MPHRRRCLDRAAKFIWSLDDDCIVSNLRVGKKADAFPVSDPYGYTTDLADVYHGISKSDVTSQSKKAAWTAKAITGVSFACIIPFPPAARQKPLR